MSVALAFECYFVTMVTLMTTTGNDMSKRRVQRAQTGGRIEKSLLKVLKGLAEYCELSLGDLLEGIVLHSFEGKAPFSEETISVVNGLKRVYGCDLTAADSHQLHESEQ